MLTEGARPIFHDEGPIEGDGSEVEITCEGRAARGSCSKTETSTMSKPATLLRPPDYEHREESASEILQSAYKPLMDLDRLQLSETEPEVEISGKKKHGAQFIVDETNSITYACWHCGSSNDVCVCAGNRGSRRERAPRSHSPPEIQVASNYNALNVNGEEEEHDEDSYEDDEQLESPNVVLEREFIHSLATPPRAVYHQERVAPDFPQIWS